MSITFKVKNGVIDVFFQNDTEYEQITTIINKLTLRYKEISSSACLIFSKDVHFSISQSHPILSDDDEPLLTRVFNYPTEEEIIKNLIQIGGTQIAAAEDDLDPIVDDIIPKGP